MEALCSRGAAWAALGQFSDVLMSCLFSRFLFLTSRCVQARLSYVAAAALAPSNSQLQVSFSLLISIGDTVLFLLWIYLLVREPMRLFTDRLAAGYVSF